MNNYNTNTQVASFTFQSWFYSNAIYDLFATAIINFTFQSGSIQIIHTQLVVYYLDCFTFQSGSIQIIPTLLNRTCLNPLHSNLVLFKLFPCVRRDIRCQLYIPIWFYSNDKSLDCDFQVYRLYIPIWFYSNISSSVAVGPCG